MKLLRKILKGASLTTALFVFQACYGTPDWLHEESAEFRVVSVEDGSPLDGIAIKSRAQANDNLDWILAGYTDESGAAQVYFGYTDYDKPQFRFESEDGEYVVKDTVITQFDHIIKVKLEKAAQAE